MISNVDNGNRDNPGSTIESEDLLRQIIDNAAVGMALLDADGRCLYVNATLCEMAGYSREECLGLTVDDIIHPEELDDARHRFGEFLRSGAGSYHTERRYVRKDGSTLHALGSLSVLSDSSANPPVRYLLQIIDIGLQKQVDAVLQEAEWRWNSALRGSRQVVWDFHVPTGMVWVSPGWKEMLDLPDEERVHHISDWLGKMHPDDRDRIAEATNEVKVSGTPNFDAVYRLQHHSSGRWIWVLSRGRVVEHAADGSITRMIGTIIDITPEKEIEARLAAVTERLDIALNAGCIGIFELDLVTGALHWDERTYALHGVTPDGFDHTAEGFFDLVHPDDVNRVRAVRNAAHREKSEYQTDYRVMHPASGSTRHLRLSARLIRDAKGTVTRSIGACWDITEDVERARRLHETLALLETVLDSTPDLVFAKNRRGRYLLANPSVAHVMGRPHDEIVGRYDTELFPPETARALIENDRRVIDLGQPHTFEESTIVDGVPRIYSSTKAPLRNERGEITGLLGISRDVTDMKATQAALRRSELRWQFALDGSGDGIWDWDVPSGYVFYSRQWKAMLGYSENEIGSTVNEWSDRVHPDDLPHCWKIINELLHNNTPDFTLEHRMRAKDGSWRWIFDRGKVIDRDEKNKPLRIIGTHTDITARKETEDAILALNQRLQLAIEAAGTGIFDLDFATGRYTWDARMYQIYDLPQDGYDGTLEGWLGFIHPDDVPDVLQRYELAVEKTSVFSMDFRIRQQRTGAIRHIRSLAKIIRDDAGAPIRAVGMNWDITDHVELAESLFEEKERLRITLHSIGDSVITTDAQVRVTFMNPIAERMTGWPAAEAIGRPLSEIFRLIDEDGANVSDPVEICLGRVQPFHLDSNAILLSRNGERRNVRDSAALVRTSTGEIIGAVLVFQDVTKARTLQQALEHSANHDSLTGLPNRSAFDRGLQQAIELAQNERRVHTLCFIDLDRFKLVNDGAGHAAGDILLCEITHLLRRSCRAHDLAARLGGDEFALLLLDCPIEEGQRIARKLQREIALHRFDWEGTAYSIGASIGLTQVGPDAAWPDKLINQADMACYASKTAGRNQISIYDDHVRKASHHHRKLEVPTRIYEAIETNRFRLFAQEIRSLKDREPTTRHFEVLLRMLDENDEIVEPEAFIPAAELYDLMGNIDRWVIRAILRNHSRHLNATRDLSIALNLSGNSLNDPFLWPFVQEELASSGVSPTRLHFEITETAVINNLSAARQFVLQARAAGCRIFLDDFGKALSTFSYLKQFPIDGLKIDGGFVRQMTESQVDRAIVESINTIGHRLCVTTVAEQVEDGATLELVCAMGIDHAQGFAIARPRPLEAVFQQVRSSP